MWYGRKITVADLSEADIILTIKRPPEPKKAPWHDAWRKAKIGY
ncbi:MAG: hypothetical protein KatS3mg006_1291 [Pyrinomonadaceae bacterium]|jgi:hypothetical protein|nr:MAG: hypothetical protein KatS3mg006_1291 [Pyrinomonadaceae bacterium]